MLFVKAFFFNRLGVETYQRKCCYLWGYPSIFAFICHGLHLEIFNIIWYIYPSLIFIHWLSCIYLYWYSLIWVGHLNLWHCFVQKIFPEKEYVPYQDSSSEFPPHPCCYIVPRFLLLCFIDVQKHFFWSSSVPRSQR